MEAVTPRCLLPGRSTAAYREDGDVVVVGFPGEVTGSVEERLDHLGRGCSGVSSQRVRYSFLAEELITGP